MKKYYILALLTFLVKAEDTSIAITINAPVAQKCKLIIALCDDTQTTADVARLLKQMLARQQCKTSGFDVQNCFITHWQRKLKKYMQRWNKQGATAALFLTDTGAETFEWRLYDVQTNALIEGKKFKKLADTRLNAEHIADSVWHILLGQEGFFSTRIALCKEIVLPSGKICKDIYVTCPYEDRQHAQWKKLIGNANAYALHWNEKLDNPLLFYSQTTNRNVRLMSVSPDGKRKVVSNFDGMNLFPSVSADGQKVVYCVSQQGKTQLCAYEWNPIAGAACLRQLTHVGNNITPTLLANGDIVFCSDAKGKPSICYYHADTEKIDYLTNDSYCTNPSYNKKLNKIAYSKMCSGTMQLWLYDLITKQHHQLTDDLANKEDCSWSPCGNYLVFTYDEGKSSRVALLNLITNERTFLTSAGERWCYPVWSPQYEVPIII